MEEVGGVADIPKGFKQFNELSYGLMELGIHTFCSDKGTNLLDNPVFNIPLARKLIQSSYRDEFIADISSYLSTQIGKILYKTELDHRFAYRVLGSGNLLIGIDVRDLEPLGEDDDN